MALKDQHKEDNVKKLIVLCSAIAALAVSALPAYAGNGSGTQGGSGGLNETVGGVVIYVAGGYGLGEGAGGCGGIYAFNTHTGTYISGSGGSVC
jgi:hypothetical protein